jgi:hypothetical protein
MLRMITRRWEKELYLWGEVVVDCSRGEGEDMSRGWG